MSALARSDLPSAGDLSARLAGRIDDLCHLFLNAGRRRGHYWCVGSVDNQPGKSMWVHLSGRSRGRWQDAGTGELGDALDLVAACRFRGDKRAAYAWALDYLGGASVMASAPKPAAEPAARADGDEVERRRRYALRLWLEAQPSLAGTPAGAYLAGRGIDLASLGRQPRALRYHPGVRHAGSGRTMPALVAAISDGEGAHIATHRIWLEPAGSGWGKARVENPKMAIGIFAGGSIRLWRGASGKTLKDAPADQPVVIGEGIETCLSIAVAVPELRVLCAVSLGNMGAVALPAQIAQVILAADNDDHPAARRAFQKVVERHMQAGRTVRVARPEAGKDFNDTLRAWR